MPAHSIHGLCLYYTMRCDMDTIRFIRFILYSGYKQCFSLPFADGCVCVLFVPNLFSTFGTYFCGKDPNKKVCVTNFPFHSFVSSFHSVRFRTNILMAHEIGLHEIHWPFDVSFSFRFPLSTRRYLRCILLSIFGVYLFFQH